MRTSVQQGLLQQGFVLKPASVWGMKGAVYVYFFPAGQAKQHVLHGAWRTWLESALHQVLQQGGCYSDRSSDLFWFERD